MAPQILFLPLSVGTESYLGFIHIYIYIVLAEYDRNATDRNSLASLAAKGDPVTKCFAMDYEPNISMQMNTTS